MYINRDQYWEKLKPFIDKPVIKVITGMRRVGKSYFILQIIDELKKSGVKKNNIIYIDKEDMDFSFIRNSVDLHEYIKENTKNLKSKVYIFIDEIQEIIEWEKTISSFLKKEKYDIFITGSNAHMLSAELATLISGRYIEFKIYPLSFKEFLIFNNDDTQSNEDAFNDYLRFGGLPALFHFERSDEIIYQYTSALYNTILLKDVVKRHNIRNVALLENIALFLFDNIGNVVSANNISKYLKSQNMRTYVDTVQEYLRYLSSSFIVHQVSRYDIKGKKHLEVNDKYFINDLGIRHSQLGYRNADIAQFLENIVFMELLRRGYRVSIGKLNKFEVDFVANKQNKTLYIQVCYLLANQEILDRELRPLLAIPDNYTKFILSMDNLAVDDLKGIKRMNIIDFLKEESISFTS